MCRPRSCCAAESVKEEGEERVLGCKNENNVLEGVDRHPSSALAGADNRGRGRGGSGAGRGGAAIEIVLTATLESGRRGRARGR